MSTTEQSGMPADHQAETSDAIEQKIDFLFKVLGRYDYYIGTINIKVSALLALNTAILFGMTLRIVLLLKQGHTVNLAWDDPLLWLGATSLSAMIAIGMLLRPLKPNTSPGISESVVFYGDVSKLLSKQYTGKIEHADMQSLMIDLTDQVHAVATITTQKFGMLQRATSFTLFRVMPLAAASLILTISKAVL